MKDKKITKKQAIFILKDIRDYNFKHCGCPSCIRRCKSIDYAIKAIKRQNKAND